ncbi:MAG: phosphoribosylaminoimidazolesuccinocarboxamide synthase [Patescibacteria group bacterium]|nr:phosphoribosylaminoimidazolesuccinocarboxamide synthase [Patescibacteria group bacterium]
MAKKAVHETDLEALELLHRGKVRDTYGIPEHPDKLLMIATDRISAYDVVMEDPIIGKGAVLTIMTLFWLPFLKDVVSNHLITADVNMYPEICKQYEEILWTRSMLVKKLTPLPVECIVRGYISGSFWSAYKKASPVADGTKNVLGCALRSDMLESEQFDKVLFTPSTKADAGEHDENISIAQMKEILVIFLQEHNLNTIDPDVFSRDVERISLELYKKAATYALERGIIIADTKFELGIDELGNLHLIDEVLTPDSSRFWPLDRYAIGRGQPSFDKQILRDYLTSSGWNKKPPPPEVPLKVLHQTADAYAVAERMLLST